MLRAVCPLSQTLTYHLWRPEQLETLIRVGEFEKWEGKRFWQKTKGMFGIHFDQTFRQRDQADQRICRAKKRKEEEVCACSCTCFPCSLCKCCHCLDSTCWSSDCSRYPLYAAIRAASLKYFALFEVVWNFRVILGFSGCSRMLPDFVNVLIKVKY